MALKLAITTPDGVSHPDAYHRIARVKVEIEGKYVDILISLYHDEASRTAGLATCDKVKLIRVREEIVVDEEGNESVAEDCAYTALLASIDGDTGLRTACYNYLKTLEEYAGAIDV